MIGLFRILLLGLWMVPGLGLGNPGQYYVNDEQVSLTLIHQSKARALLFGYFCYLYETDNGRFPLTEANLRWPIDYVEPWEKQLGVSFDEVASDPLAGGARFEIRPVIPDDAGIRDGIFVLDGPSRFIVLSRARHGSVLGRMDVLREAALRDGSEYTDPDGDVFYLSERTIGAVGSKMSTWRETLITSAGLTKARPVNSAPPPSTESRKDVP